MTSGILKFSNGNKKLGSNITIFSLPAGYSCPFAKSCLSKATKYKDEKNNTRWKMVDGANTEVRCYAASEEARYPNVRKMRWYNYNLLRNCGNVESLVELISFSLQVKLQRNMVGLVRIHESGDFFNEKYFLAWCEIARLYPNIHFYAYTKSLNYWFNNMGSVPNNFVLTASYGSKLDHLIETEDVKSARIMFSYDEAIKRGLNIDTNDSIAMSTDKKPFGIMLHGTQPKTLKEANFAWKLLRREKMENKK